MGEVWIFSETTQCPLRKCEKIALLHCAFSMNFFVKWTSSTLPSGLKVVALLIKLLRICRGIYPWNLEMLVFVVGRKLKKTNKLSLPDTWDLN